jgi:hypothetical protein
MEKKIQYVCPKDTDVVLFEEIVDIALDRTVNFAGSESPATCPKCGGAFSKPDCDMREV